MMKAAEVVVTDGVACLQMAERERPLAAAGEILIEVYAAGVTSAELSWYPTTHTREGVVRDRAIPGHEFSGRIAALGEGVKGFRIGDSVYGMNDWFAEGATAEFCLTTPGQIARMPTGMSYAVAATAPISALTAWQGVLERGGLRMGERILVHGGAGSVGLFAVQLARRQGAHVVATASKDDREFVRRFGADVVLDYKAKPFDEMDGLFDVVFDTVGGDTLERSFSLLTEGGRVTTVASSAEQGEDTRIKDAFFIVEPCHTQLAKVGRLLEEKKLTTCLKATVPLRDANVAYRNALPKTRSHGKVVVLLRDEAAGLI